jgi:non-heme chloroperoxidase
MDTFADDLAELIEKLELQGAALVGFSMGGGEVARYIGRHGSAADRSQFYKDLAGGPFFGANRPGSKVSQGMIDSFWLQGMQAGHKNTFDCIKAFSETDFTEDLKKFDVPTLIIHGDDDQIVPIETSAHRSAKLVRNATLKVYPGAPHGLTYTHQDQLNADLVAFLKT